MTSKLNLVVLLCFISYQMTCTAQHQYPFEVKITGQGKQSIILIPGFASSGEVWEETSAAFENNFTCYTLTMAGFAGIPAQPNITFQHWKTEIANYIKNNNIVHPILIGHSMGGVLALAIAADFPDLIGKIVVVDGLPALMALTNPDFKSDENLDCSIAVQQFKEMTDESFYEMQKAGLPMMLSNTDMHDTVLGWSLASDRETFAKMYCDFANTDLRADLGKIKCPALILLESYFINFKTAIEAQYQNLTTGKLLYANKGLHFIMYDDKDWYFEQLDKFITAH